MCKRCLFWFANMWDPQNSVRKESDICAFTPLDTEHAKTAALYEKLITWIMWKDPIGKYLKQWSMLRMQTKGCIFAWLGKAHNLFFLLICRLLMPTTNVVQWRCAVSNLGFIHIYACSPITSHKCFRHYYQIRTKLLKLLNYKNCNFYFQKASLKSKLTDTNILWFKTARASQFAFHFIQPLNQSSLTPINYKLSSLVTISSTLDKRTSANGACLIKTCVCVRIDLVGFLGIN